MILSPHRLLAAGALVGLLATTATAQTFPWNTTFPSTFVSGRERVFNGTDGTLSYMYGGQNGASVAGLDELYSWDGTDWTLLTASGTGPGPRAGGASCWDAARGKFVIFGGRDFGAGVNLGDTWEWDAVNGWVQLTPAVSPSARWLMGDTSAYVPGLGLVFHGGNVGGVIDDETWAFDGTNWTLISTGPDRQVASMAYRPGSNDMILYGGVSGASTAATDETWRLDLGTQIWSQIVTATSPSHPSGTADGLLGQVTYFNPVTNRVVLYGGNGVGSGGTPSYLTWEFDGTDWVDATDPSQLASENLRNSMAVWVASSNSAVVLCGNRANGSNFDFVLEHGPFPTNPVTSFCNGDGGDQMGCTNCPCGNNAPVGTIGGCLNQSGSSAQLIADGSSSVTAADPLDLSFTMTGGNPATLAVLTSGDALAPQNAANPCFGTGNGVMSAVLDGLRCAVSNTQRHGGRPMDAAGDVGLTNNGWGGAAGPMPNIATQGGFVAGQTRYFQVFYRADTAQGCGTGQNTTQALEVTFAP